MNPLYHFIGIGGIGMSALARILLQKGYCVQGSDCSSSKITKELEDLGARILYGHSKDHLDQSCTVIFSTDIKEDNEELLQAKKIGLRCYHRSEFLAYLLQGYKSLLVTGTHGKTTTSSLLAHVLAQARLDPSFAVGGVLKNFQANSQWGSGEFFVAEADESDGSFLAYPIHGAIITNIDLDHLNYWHTEDALVKGFEQFAARVADQSLLFYCLDDARLSALPLKGVGYGFSPQAQVHIDSVHQSDQKMIFSLSWKGKHYKDIIIPLIGIHNVLNATAVFSLCLTIGVKEEEIRLAFSTFVGVGRRADFIGEVNSICFYDDYGHHPTEIKATVKAFKETYPAKRLVTVFQPHRFTRTRDCLDEFSDAFTQSDVVVLTDLYPAGENPIEGVDSQSVYERVSDIKKEGVHLLKKEVLVDFLSAFLQANDIVLTMGAGDITQFGPRVLDKMKA